MHQFFFQFLFPIFVHKSASNFLRSSKISCAKRLQCNGGKNTLAWEKCHYNQKLLLLLVMMDKKKKCHFAKHRDTWCISTILIFQTHHWKKKNMKINLHDFVLDCISAPWELPAREFHAALPPGVQRWRNSVLVRTVETPGYRRNS